MFSHMFDILEFNFDILLVKKINIINQLQIMLCVISKVVRIRVKLF